MERARSSDTETSSRFDVLEFVRSKFASEEGNAGLQARPQRRQHFFCPRGAQ